MKAARDPEGLEARNLLGACPLDTQAVLEIGSGTGWLTWQYAQAAKRVVGIDPDLPSLQDANTDRPAQITNISLVQSMGEALPFSPGSFDMAIFSNSL